MRSTVTIETELPNPGNLAGKPAAIRTEATADLDPQEVQNETARAKQVDPDLGAVPGHANTVVDHEFATRQLARHRHILAAQRGNRRPAVVV